MKSTVEPLEGNKVKLLIEVDEAEFEPQLDAAFKRIAREVRIPGFRPGKAPRRLLEARVGTEAARADALQHAIPEYYGEAVVSHEVDIIDQPEIDITAGQESGPVAFEAVVEVRPRIVIGGYKSLRVTLPSPVPTEADVDERVDQLRKRFAQLETVERPAQDGDQVTIDISGSQDNVPMSGLTAEDYLYEVGSAAVVPEMDEQLRGAKVGDILKFTADHPDPDEEFPIDFSIFVKEIKEAVLPEADDAFADDASEFPTIEALRADIAERLATVRKAQAQMALQQKTGIALAELVDEDIPDALVNAQMQNRLQELAMRFEAQGISLEQFLSATGQDPQVFVDQLREQATIEVKTDLGLRAVAEAEEIEVTEDDLEQEYAVLAERLGQKADRIRDQLERNGQGPLVRSDIQTRKALDWLTEHVEIVDEDGNPIDRAHFTAETDEETDESATPDADSTDAPAEAPSEDPSEDTEDET